MKTLSVALIALALAPTSGSLSLLRDGDNKVALALNGVVGTYDERAAIVADLLQVESRGTKAPDPRLAAVRNAYATVAATPAAAASLRQGDTLRYYDDAQFKLEIAVSRLLAVSDSDRKMLADKRYRALKVRLRSIELRIGIAREQYDNAVAVYNARLHTFPTRVTARVLGFREDRTFADIASHTPLPRGLLIPGARSDPWV
ncbi:MULTISPECIES: LemA family protein [Burkholderia]|uniref:LemA family protein n=1 Tax=Burkholderia TaxID=32008 RepID=UPI00187B503B|nr:MULTISPECIES: LemA family protein [Burkholderia]UVE65474.1 LemA family protein [Burkholderia pyrrocinia]